MLQAVQVIHDEKIVHSDLKPANFVLVKGQLKLIDFGIANAIANDTTNIQRDHTVRSSSGAPTPYFLTNRLLVCLLRSGYYRSARSTICHQKLLNVKKTCHGSKSVARLTSGPSVVSSIRWSMATLHSIISAFCRR